MDVNFFQKENKIIGKNLRVQLYRRQIFTLILFYFEAAIC
jgi:hypothetical protein